MAKFYNAGLNWHCPSCRSNIVLTQNDYTEHETLDRLPAAVDTSNGYLIHREQIIACRLCGYFTMTVGLYRANLDGNKNPTSRPDRSDRWVLNGTYAERQIYPPAEARAYEASIVPSKIIRDYTEAAAVAEVSPRAAMILARRALESIVFDFYQGKGNTLHAALQSVKGKIEPNLFDALMALKGLGNIGAHPGDDVTLDVEITPSEAQQAIRMIELLLDVTYIEREKRQQTLKTIVDTHSAKKTP